MAWVRLPGSVLTVSFHAPNLILDSREVLNIKAGTSIQFLWLTLRQEGSRQEGGERVRQNQQGSPHSSYFEVLLPEA